MNTIIMSFGVSACPNQTFLISSVMANVDGIELLYSALNVAALPLEPQRFKLTRQVWFFSGAE